MTNDKIYTDIRCKNHVCKETSYVEPTLKQRREHKEAKSEPMVNCKDMSAMYSK